MDAVEHLGRRAVGIGERGRELRVVDVVVPASRHRRSVESFCRAINAGDRPVPMGGNVEATRRAEVRGEWLGLLERYRYAPDRPDDDRFWSADLETASRDELRAIQGEKLAVAVRYAYECIPFYRRKLDAIGLSPTDVRGVDDLQLLPVTTKQEMADDLAEHPPWGTYTAVDDDIWRERGWQIFASSGTTGAPRAFRYTQFDREQWAWANAARDARDGVPQRP